MVVEDAILAGGVAVLMLKDESKFVKRLDMRLMSFVLLGQLCGLSAFTCGAVQCVHLGQSSLFMQIMQRRSAHAGHSTIAVRLS